MKRLLLVVAVFVSLASSLVPSMAFACDSTGNSSKDQVISGSGATGNDCNGNGVLDIVSTAVNILSLAVGAVAIIMIIIAGFRYITSGGDSNRVSSAKNTLLYAAIGLVVAALAQLLVHFVLFQTNQATLPKCPADHSIKPPDCKA